MGVESSKLNEFSEPEILKQLKDLGVPEDVAKRIIALFNTRLMMQFEKWRLNYIKRHCQKQAELPLMETEKLAVFERQGNVVVIRPFIFGSKPSNISELADADYIRVESADRRPFNLYRKVHKRWDEVLNDGEDSTRQPFVQP